VSGIYRLISLRVNIFPISPDFKQPTKRLESKDYITGNDNI